jgi:hypothetical protein
MSFISTLIFTWLVLLRRFSAPAAWLSPPSVGRGMQPFSQLRSYAEDLYCDSCGLNANS